MLAAVSVVLYRHLEFRMALVPLWVFLKAEERQHGGWHLAVEVSTTLARQQVKQLTRYSPSIWELVSPHAGMAAKRHVWRTYASLWRQWWRNRKSI